MGFNPEFNPLGYRSRMGPKGGRGGCGMWRLPDMRAQFISQPFGGDVKTKSRSFGVKNGGSIFLPLQTTHFSI